MNDKPPISEGQHTEAQTEDLCAALIELELELLKPQVRADASRLDALIADDFTEIAGTGRRFGKREAVSRLPAESGIVFATEHMQARLLSANVGLVTYDARRSASGSAVHSKRSSIWVRSSEAWQMIHHQGTLCDPPAAAEISA